MQNKKVYVYDHTHIENQKDITFGSPVVIDNYVCISISSKVFIGDYVHIGMFSSILGSASFSIGNLSSLSVGCRVFTSSDDYVGFGFGNLTVPTEYRNIKVAPVSIGNFVTIGTNTVILPGVTIQDGVTVGANSVVTKDLQEWGVYIGNKRIKDRNKIRVLNEYEKFIKNERDAK